MKKSVLVTLADRQFLDQVKQLFASAYLAGGWDGDYLLLAHDLSNEETKPFRERGILVKDCPPLVFGEKGSIGQGQNTWSDVVWSKLYLFDQSFKRWEHVVFLDSDIIVRQSILTMVGADGLWAATDNFYPALRNRFIEGSPEKIKRLKRDYANLRGRSFNSGVLTYHTDLIKEDSFEKLKKSAWGYGDVSYSDEGVLNLFFQKSWRPLPMTYNMLVPYWLEHCRLRPDQIRGVIWHFVGRREKDKPWHKNCPFNLIWNENRKRFDSIDFNSLPPLASEMSSTESRRYCRRLSWRCFFYFRLRLDRQIGLIGLLLKRADPDLYYQLKKIKDVLPIFGHRAGA